MAWKDFYIARESYFDRKIFEAAQILIAAQDISFHTKVLMVEKIFGAAQFLKAAERYFDAA
jgi:hypothetical protein